MTLDLSSILEIGYPRSPVILVTVGLGQNLPLSVRLDEDLAKNSQFWIFRREIERRHVAMYFCALVSQHVHQMKVDLSLLFKAVGQKRRLSLWRCVLKVRDARPTKAKRARTI